MLSGPYCIKCNMCAAIAPPGQPSCEQDRQHAASPVVSMRPKATARISKAGPIRIRDFVPIFAVTCNGLLDQEIRTPLDALLMHHLPHMDCSHRDATEMTATITA